VFRLKDLLGAVAVGARDEDLFTSLANRLTRLINKLPKKRKSNLKKNREVFRFTVVKELLNAYNPDTVEEIEQKIRTEKMAMHPLKLKLLLQRTGTTAKPSCQSIYR
jgi:type I restriction enzyme R subunit